jgi:methionyl-tRNA formyltransferase
MRIVLFGAGSPLSLACFRALRDDEIAAVVVPFPSLSLSPRALRRALQRRRGARPLIEAARARGIHVIPFGQPLIDADLYVVAAFPFILQSDVLGRPRLGALNLHFSVLPRHRGPSPLPPAYLADDATTGVTLHWMTEETDAGDIASQEEIPLARGRHVLELYDELCERAAALLRRTIDGGAIPHMPQAAPPAEPRFAIDFATWGTERVWHVLAGLGSRFGRLLPVRHGHARGFEVAPHDRAAGTIEKRRGHYRVYCVDGFVDVSRFEKR